ncbi:MAG: hypothetical protein AB1714_20120 [Acidobacteriota bacterium]
MNPAKPMNPETVSSGHYSGSCSYIYRRKKHKTDWAGISIGDAFKPEVDYYIRMAAQRLFYQAVKRVQVAAAQLAGVATDDDFQPAVKPQLSPCYTSYPPSLAAYAAVGLTGFLDFQERVAEKILLTHMQDYLKDPAVHDRVRVEPEIYKQMAEIVAAAVQTRLLLEDLSRSSSMASVELYRLFSASQQNMKFRSVREIINAVILYGDVLPDLERQSLHPITATLAGTVVRVCRPFFEQLAGTRPHRLLDLGKDWVRAVCLALSRHLPLPKSRTEEKPAREGERPAPDQAVLSALMRRLGARYGRQRWQRPADSEFRFSPDYDAAPVSDAIPPLDGPQPPALFESAQSGLHLVQALLGKIQEAQRYLGLPDEDELESPIGKTWSDFMKALQQAGGQSSKWEDMRSDLVEHVLRETAFSTGPIEGNPSEGHEVNLMCGGLPAGGEIFDRPVELSEDAEEVETLIAESQVITDAMQRALYPNIEQTPETERFCSSGLLDPARLAMVDASNVVFKRYRIHEKVDRRGRPVLLLACDGSGSLDTRQMRMVKILAAAWLRSTARTEVQVLAGLYHSDQIREGVSGPLIQWIHHPRKTPAISRTEAVRAVASLPYTGTGVQSDALSLAFMLEEARRVARCKMVYLILISDCEWNRSFNSGKSGAEEVRDVLEESYRRWTNRLHVTLVALGVEVETEFENLVNKVMTVPEKNLTEYTEVARQVGVYVASCMTERRRLLSKR